MSSTRDLFNLSDRFPDLPSEYAVELDRRAYALQALIDKTKEAMKIIARDPALTGQGRAERAQAIASELTKTMLAKGAEYSGMDLYRKGIEVLRTMATEEQRQAMRPPAGWTEERAIAQERETRDLMRGMDPLALRQLLLESAYNGDVTTLKAFYTAPPGFPLATKVDLERASLAHARLLFPDQFKQALTDISIAMTLRWNVDWFSTVADEAVRPGSIGDLSTVLPRIPDEDKALIQAAELVDQGLKVVGDEQGQVETVDSILGRPEPQPTPSEDAIAKLAGGLA